MPCRIRRLGVPAILPVVNFAAVHKPKVPSERKDGVGGRSQKTSLRRGGRVLIVLGSVGVADTTAAYGSIIGTTPWNKILALNVEHRTVGNGCFVAALNIPRYAIVAHDMPRYSIG